MSDDQKALLRLLAQREEGYEDIAALMGLSVDEVRRRVREAVAELNETAPAVRDEDSPAAGPVVAGDPPPPPVAKASSGAVAPTTPPAEKRTAPAPAPARAPAATVSRQPRPKPQLSMPKDRRRLVELIGGAVVVILVLLFATGAIDIGGGDDSDSDSGSDATSAATDVAKGSTKLTQAILQPVDGGEAKGLAVFARSKGSVLLLLQAESLEPAGKGQAYAVSLSRSPTERIPIAITRVPQSGTIEAQYPIPSEALGLLANGFDQMEVSLVSNAELKAALAEAGKEQKAPTYAGEDILRGEVTGPIVNVAAKEEG
jgi:hypothetical protein